MEELSLVLLPFAPIAVGVFLMLFPLHGLKGRPLNLVQGALALPGSCLPLILIVFLLLRSFEAISSTGLSYQVSWIETLSVFFELKLDGFSVLSVIALAVLFPVFVLFELRQSIGREKVSQTLGLLLVEQGALMGLALAHDLFLITTFSALAILPLFFLIVLFGGERRTSAGQRLLATQGLGTLLGFFSFAILYSCLDSPTFCLSKISSDLLKDFDFHLGSFSISAKQVAYFFFVFSFFLRLPVVPFSGWFVDVMVSGPTLARLGLFGGFIPAQFFVFFRLTHELFPEEYKSYSSGLLVFMLIGLFLSSWANVLKAKATDLFSVVGQFKTQLTLASFFAANKLGMDGAFLGAMTSFVSVILFCILVDWVTYDEEDRFNADFKGVYSRSPSLGSMFCGVVLIELGMPGFSSFFSMSQQWMGLYFRFPIAIIFVLSSYVFFARVSLNFLTTRVLGLETKTADGKVQAVLSSGWAEKAIFGSVLVAMLMVGLYPKVILDLTDKSVRSFVSRVGD